MNDAAKLFEGYFWDTGNSFSWQLRCVALRSSVYHWASLAPRFNNMLKISGRNQQLSTNNYQQLTTIINDQSLTINN